jgi:hypothetical protein
MTRTKALVVAVAAATLLVTRPADAQDANEYRRRFLEEIQRKIPPLTVTPPSAAERAALRAPAAKNIAIDEARALLGLAQPMTAARLPGGKLAIIDSGFKGIRERLDAVPAEKALTTIMRPPAGADGQPASGSWDSDHGYWVYRVVRAVAPDLPVLLYTVNGLAQAGEALLHAGTQGVVVSNLSLSFPSHFQIFDSEEDQVSKYLRVYMPQQEGFVFISSGNEREDVHSFVSADRNNNGFVDMHDAPIAGRDIDGLRIKAKTGTHRTVFTWDAGAHPDADYELQIVGKDGTVYYSSRDKLKKGLIYLRFGFSQPVEGTIRVKRLAGPASGVFMRINAYPIGVIGDFNGLQTTNAYLFRENPFATYVGSFGRTADGRLSPSRFSNIGTARDGRLVPHLLGPGQLLIDGKPTNGTSFSSPFITALYATRVGYNFKNLIARTSNFNRLAPGVAPHERSRWGIPDPALLARLESVVGPTKVEGVTHAVENDHLVLKFAVTRCCMESLSWSIVASMTDALSGQPLRASDGKPVSGVAYMRGDKADFVRHPTEIRIPLATMPDIKGKKLRVVFDIKVRRWPNPPPGTLKIDQAPVYDVTL